jgi:redox-regulated HSP33 family molecular chaperone
MSLRLVSDNTPTEPPTEGIETLSCQLCDQSFWFISPNAEITCAFCGEQYNMMDVF